MKKLCSLNFLPSDEDAVWLSATVSSLSKIYDAPVFIPHLTIYGNLNIDLKELHKIAQRVMKNIEVFSTEVERISFLDTLGKTLFIQIKENEVLQNVYQRLKKELGHNSSYQLNPHISLMYKSGISSIEKEDLVKTLPVPKTVRFTKWSIVTVDTQWSNVASWKTEYQENLALAS